MTYQPIAWGLSVTAAAWVIAVGLTEVRMFWRRFKKEQS